MEIGFAVPQHFWREYFLPDSVALM
jgi:hypothetical protein